MRDYYSEIAEHALVNIKASRFLGVLKFAQPLNHWEIAWRVLRTIMKGKSYNYKVLIVINTVYKRRDIFSILSKDKEIEHYLKNRNIIINTSDFIINSTFSQDYNVVLYLDDNAESNYNEVYDKVNSSYSLSFTNCEDVLSKRLPTILDVTKNDLKEIGFIEELKEVIIPVMFNDDNQELIDGWNEYISDSCQIFGDIENIFACCSTSNETSAEELRRVIAIEGGYSSELDPNNQFDSRIIEMYHPQNLYVRASNTKDFIIKRRQLISDGEEKLERIVQIVKNNLDKKILIIAKRPSFADKIVDRINSTIPKSSTNYKALPRVLKNNNIPFNVAMPYHKNIDSGIFYDFIMDDYVRNKTGKSKGNPKILGAKNKSNFAAMYFTEGYLNVLCTTSNMWETTELDVDLIINTSSKNEHYSDIRLNVTHLAFRNEPIIYNVIYSPLENETLETKLSDYSSTILEYISDSINDY